MNGMEIQNIEAILEAILFASGDPVPVDRLSEIVEIEPETVYQLCLTLRDRMEKNKSALTLVELDGCFQMTTRIEYADPVKKALEIRRNTPLSQAAMEVLAIVAYNQPVSKGFVEQVRGVDSSQIVNNLIDKGLLEEAGRLDLPGKPLSYRTTKNFLRCFGMKTLENLPPLPDESGQVMLDEVVHDQHVSGSDEPVGQPEINGEDSD